MQATCDVVKHLRDTVATFTPCSPGLVELTATLLKQQRRSCSNDDDDNSDDGRYLDKNLNRQKKKSWNFN